MPIAIKMPALSPTMEEGTLAKWLVKVGDKVSSGDIMAEIETDKATMEFEAVDEGTIAEIAVAEGTEGVKVGTVIATLAEEGEDLAAAKAAGGPAKAGTPAAKEESTPQPVRAEPVEAPPSSSPAPAAKSGPSTSSGQTGQGAVAKAASGDRVIASPLAKRIAADKGIDLAGVKGSGPNGRIVKADVEGVPAQAGTSGRPAQPTEAPASAGAPGETPYLEEKLSGMRKTIARRLTESKQQVPHIYLTVDIRLDALLKLRAELNSRSRRAA